MKVMTKMEISSQTKLKSHNTTWLIPLIIFVMALSIRVVGLDFSLPLLTHADEGYFMDTLPGMSVNQTLDPGKYNYPSFPSFYSKYILLNLLSYLKFGANYGVTYSRDLNYFYYYTRLLTAIQGALIPVTAWMIGKRFKRIDFSLPAAILFTFYPPFVVHSHYVTVDIPLTLYVMLALLYCLNYLATKKLLWLILGCLMVAVSAMEKYPGILAYGIVLVTVGTRALSLKGERHKHDWGFFFKTVALTLLVTMVFIIIIAPPLFLHFDTAWEQIQREARTTHLGADGLGWGGNLLYYLGIFRTSAGLIVSILAIIGIVPTILQRDPLYLLLFFGVGYWIALSKLSLHWERWSLPMITSPLLLAGFAITQLGQTLCRNILLKGFAIAGLVVFAILYALNGFTSSVVMTWRDTRVDGLQYLTKHGITPENSISEGYTPFLPQISEKIFDYKNPDEKDFVILSSNMYGRYAADPERYLIENAFYAGIRQKSTLIKEFNSNSKPTNALGQFKVVVDYFQNLLRGIETDYRKGPIIQIYQLPQ